MEKSACDIRYDIDIFAIKGTPMTRFGPTQITERAIDTVFNNVLQRDATDADIDLFTLAINGGIITGFDFGDELVSSLEADLFVDPIIRLFNTVLGREADINGLDAFSDAFRAGASLADLAQTMFVSGEGIIRYGENTPPELLIDALYTVILNREADPDGKAAHLDALANGQTVGELMVAFSQSEEFLQRSDEFTTLLLREASTREGFIFTDTFAPEPVIFGDAIFTFDDGATAIDLIPDVGIVGFAGNLPDPGISPLL